MDDIRVQSWNELNDALFEDSWRESLKRYRSNYVFRGISSFSQSPLITSLMRIGKGYQDREAVLLRNFIKYAHHTSQSSLWSWLSLAQHHGLPTRLLDCTYSPYVALHFATADIQTFHEDGVIWCINFKEINRFLPQKLKKILDAERAMAFTVDMLSQGVANLRELMELEQEHGRAFVLFLEPPSLDDRIINQFALFSLMSNPTARLDHWLQENPGLYRRIIIPAGLKWEVRDKLDQANITERVLFPGLDGLCLWLKRYYAAVEIP